MCHSIKCSTWKLLFKVLIIFTVFKYLIFFESIASYLIVYYDEPQSNTRLGLHITLGSNISLYQIIIIYEANNVASTVYGVISRPC